MATTLETTIGSRITARPSSSFVRLSIAQGWLLPSLVLVAAICTAGLLYVRFLPEHRQLWNDFEHDRHAHFYSGLCLAEDIRHLRPLQLLSDLDKFRTWPPFHDGLLVGTAALLGNGDPRWGVLPSLLAWVGTAVFAFLLARRAAPWGGSVAGLFAALFVLVSPAHRAYATDVMIESTGACLTLASLYFYLVAVQEPSARSGRLLGLSLTLLFLTKYNYWGLAALAIFLHHVSVDLRGSLSRFKRLVGSSTLRERIAGELRQPLNYLIAGMTLFIVVLQVTGGRQVELFGKPTFLHVSGQLFTALYWMIFLRLIVWYRATGSTWVSRLNPVGRSFVAWHFWPIAVWFLWPDRFYSFAWVANPGINSGEKPHFDLVGGYPFYWSTLASDYHIATGGLLAVLVLTLVAIGYGLRGRLRPGAGAVLCLVVLAFFLTVHHPNRKSRFLHSWLAASWVAAGVGAGCLLRPRRSVDGQFVRVGFAASLASLAVLQLPAFAAPGHSPEGGIHAGRPSILDLTDTYLPHLASSRRAAVFSNTPMKQLAQWTYMQRYSRDVRLETDIKGFQSGAVENRILFERWLAATSCDTIVYVANRPDDPLVPFDIRSSLTNGYGEFLDSQEVFRVVERKDFPALNCAVTVWKRPTP